MSDEIIELVKQQAAMLEQVAIDRAADKFWAAVPAATTAEGQLLQIAEPIRDSLDEFVRHMSHVYGASSLLEWYGNQSAVTQDLWLRGVLSDSDDDDRRQKAVQLFLRPVETWIADNVESSKETARMVELLKLQSRLDEGSGTAKKRKRVSKVEADLEFDRIIESGDRSRIMELVAAKQTQLADIAGCSVPTIRETHFWNVGLKKLRKEFARDRRERK